MWIGTAEGLCRYDGHNFQIYTTRDGLPDNNVFTIREDSYGRLWLVCYNGVPCYIAQGIIRTPQNDSLCRTIARADIAYRIFYRDSHGRNCLVGKRHCVVGKNGISSLYPNLQFNTQNIDCYSTPKGDFCSDGAKFFQMVRSDRVLFQVKLDKVDASTSAGNHLLLAGMDGGSKVLYDVRVDGAKAVEIRRVIIRRHCYSMFVNTGGDIVLTTDSGLITYDTATGAATNSDLLQLPLSVNRMCKDGEGNYWFTTIHDGVYLRLNREAKILNTENVLRSNHVQFAKAYDSDKIIVGYDDGIVSMVKGDSRKDYLIPFMGSQNRVIYAYPLSAEKLVVGVDQGAFILSLKDGRAQRIIPNAQKDAFQTKDGLYIAHSAGANLLRFQGLMLEDVCSFRTTAITEDSRGSVWLGTLSGLFCKTGEKTTRFSKDSSLGNAHITALCCYGSKLIIGTHKDGLYVWNEGELLHIKVEQGLSSNSCREIAADDSGHVWVCTDVGIDRLSLRNSPAIQVYHYSRGDGLIAKQANHIELDRNSIYLSTTQGVLVLSRTPDGRNLSPNTFINWVRTRDTVFYEPAIITASYGSDDLEINFTGISYSEGNSLEYRYVLEGAGSDTVYTRLSTINLGAVRPGKHRFMVWSKVGNSSWSVKPAEFLLTIKPPFWLTYWFSILAITAVGATIWMIYRQRLKKMITEEQMRAQQQRQIIQLEIDALRAQMNPHFMFNVLSSIQSFYSQNNELQANRYLTSFSRFFRKTLLYAKNHWIPLDEEIKLLKSYVELEQMRFNGRFVFDFRISPRLNPPATGFPAMLLQPYIENAIAHGLSHPDIINGALLISFDIIGNEISCKIEDNGVGIHFANQHKADAHQSIGMKLCSQRIALLNQLYDAGIVMEISETAAEHPFQKGTLILIKMPLRKL